VEVWQEQVVILLRLAGERVEWKFGEGEVVNLLRLAGERAEWKFGKVLDFFICWGCLGRGQNAKSKRKERAEWKFREGQVF
jgi:hypothetical protein